MQTRPFILATTLAATTLATLTAQANQLEPVVVNGSRTTSLANEMPTGTVTLTRDDIQSLSATSLTEVLDTVGGINARRLYGAQGSRTSLDMMGFGATGNQNTLVLLNGRRFSHIDQAALNLSAIPLVAIERIEVLPGAGAALYGNGAVGGTVNIVTRQSYDDSAGLEASAGSFNTTGGRVHATAGEQHLSGALALETLHSDGYRDNGELRQHNAFADMRYHGDGFNAYFSATGEQQEQGLAAGRSGSDFKDDPEGTATPQDDAEQDNYWLMPGLSVAISDTTTLTLDAGKRRQTQAFFYAPTSRGNTTVETLSVTPKLSGQTETGPLVHNWTLGMDWYRYDYQQRASYGDRELKQEQNAWYLHNMIAITPRLSVSAGARHLESTLHGSGQRDNQDGELYEGGLRYTFAGNLALFAGAQRSVRIANLDELSPFNTEPVSPQTGHGYTVGASWSEGHQHSTLTFWQTDIENEIVFDPNTGAFGANRNLADPTRHRGISLDSRWQLDDDLTLAINGSIQRAVFQDGPYERQSVPLVPQSTLQVSAEWQALPWLAAKVSHRYVGNRYFDSDLDNEHRKLDAYRTSDLELTARHRHAYLKVGAYNLEDHLYADYGVVSEDNTGNPSFTRYPLPERNYRVAVGMEF